MKYNIIILTIFGLTFPKIMVAQLDSIDYTIYNCYLDYLSNDTIKNKPLFFNKCFIINQNTTGISLRKTESKQSAEKGKKNTLKYYYNDLMDETISSFLEKNIDTFLLETEKFSKNNREVFVANERVFLSIIKNINKDYVPDLPVKYQNCYHLIVFSNIGYNQSKSQALFYTQLLQTGFSSSTWFVVLEEISGTWKVVKTIYLSSS
jgi:hypothetical protein